MIKSLTTYYVYVPFVSPLTSLTCTSYTFELFIWNGEKSNPPTEASFEITKNNPTASVGNDKLDISNLISDFVNFTQQEGSTTELINGNNQVWVKWQVYYATSNPLDATTPSEQNTVLMSKGYSYAMDGENATTPVNKILLSGNEFKVNRQGIFVLPIEIEETTVTLATLTIDNITSLGGDQYELSFTSTGNLDIIYYRYKLDGAGSWDVGFESSNTSPFDITLPTAAGTYNVQIFAYDNDNAVNVYSNIFNVIVV
jgi:hypothetical protein